MNGTGVLIKDILELPPHLCHVTRSGFSPVTKSAGTLILEFPGSRTVTNRCLLSIRHSVCGVL